ncbi:hypothetical protein BGP78_06410 [Pseudoalteromonas sp. MSK9-3]|uniref:hypothetical protein n=1 Tax=Pseudoalteromonas sp. MSK9-3 TaxID=1897633 RepID=UPI000E6B6F94|nr:hypothetical protein [Pseudoalteromonas sp. MSK9-3]RJE78139.1 hypothetical protein BGP78_06410 [Pseudoalteromonas sp. MSK9-3]
MTLEKTLSNVALEAAKHADLANQLIEGVKDGIDTIEVVSQNHSVMDDWRTKTGKVAFKDLAGNTHQVDTLATIIADAEKINPNPHVMTKAQFDALRDIRKKQYAGSGFVEWGKHYTTTILDNVNEGLFSNNNSNLLWGRGSDNNVGISSTDYPMALINGVSHSIRAVNEVGSQTQNSIPFPSAPNGTKTYDSATGVVTEHASAAEAFGGLAKAAKSHVWDRLTSHTYTNGATSFQMVDNTESESGYIDIRLNLTVGVRYEISVVSDGPISNGVYGSRIRDASDGTHIASFSNENAAGTHIATFTAPTAGHSILLYTHDTTTNYSEFSIRPITEQVIISRKDLVFLESWHEKIADKDVVYPLGNVQYGANSYDGIGLLNNLVAQGYSAFGEWDTNTTGHGAKWSGLSEANRAKLLANPAHNIYYDPEVKAYIQVRYRIRVVEGVGDDFDYTYAYRGITTSWRPNRGNTDYPYFNVRGQNVLSDDYYDSGSTSSNGYFNPPNNSQREIINGSDFEGFASKKRIGHNNKCFAVPIALVQRMNQGAYHPTYNPMGTAVFTKSGVANYHWHNLPTGSIVSISDCFMNATSTKIGKHTGSGFISAPYTGPIRNDQYKYYDAIYAGQVEDLRLNANKLDVNQLREDSIRKAVAGEMRGKGKVPFTRTYISSGTAVASNTNGFIPVPVSSVSGDLSWINRNNQDTQKCQGKILVNGVAYDINGISYAGSNFENIALRTTYPSDASSGDSIQAVFGDYLPSEFDSLPCVDIIGDPKRIAATFPDGVIGQWIPQIPDGSSKEFQLNTKLNGSTFNSAVRTIDDGVTFSDLTGAFNSLLNTAKNSITHPIVTGYVALVAYKSPSNFTEPSTNSVVLGDVGKVHTSADNFVSQSNRLTPSLIGKIGKDNQDGNQLRGNSVTNAPLTSYSKLWNSNKVTHTPITLRKPINDSPAVKALPTITEKDGLLYLQFHGAELRYDTPTIVQITLNNSEIKATKGTIYRVASEVNSPLAGGVWYCNTTTSAAFDDITWSKNSDGNIRAGGSVSDPNIYFIPHYVAGWGDDQVIPIVSGENVKTDLNGNTVKVFCHHTQIPIGIAHHG